MAELKKYLGNKIEEGVKQSNTNIAAVGVRLDKAEQELENHKKYTQASIDALTASVDAVSAKLGMGNASIGSTSYVSAAGRVLSVQRPSLTTQSQEAHPVLVFKTKCQDLPCGRGLREGDVGQHAGLLLRQDADP